jgi:hypothetical protein
MNDQNTEDRLVLNEQEQHLIRMIRAMQFGEIRIFVAESKPVRAEEVKKSVSL